MKHLKWNFKVLLWRISLARSYLHVRLDKNYKGALAAVHVQEIPERQLKIKH